LAFLECQCSGSATIFVSHVISNVLLVAFQCGLPKSVALAAAALLITIIDEQWKKSKFKGGHGVFLAGLGLGCIF